MRKFSKSSKIYFYFPVIKFSDIKEVFIQNSQYNLLNNESYITYDRFNQIISILFKFDIPILCHTYLAKRIFELLSKVNIILFSIYRKKITKYMKMNF
jgi:hypothetical protein